jgi:hypothetical protein
LELRQWALSVGGADETLGVGEAEERVKRVLLSV